MESKTIAIKGELRHYNDATSVNTVVKGETNRRSYVLLIKTSIHAI